MLELKSTSKLEKKSLLGKDNFKLPFLYENSTFRKTCIVVILILNIFEIFKNNYMAKKKIKYHRILAQKIQMTKNPVLSKINFATKIQLF